MIFGMKRGKIPSKLTGGRAVARPTRKKMG